MRALALILGAMLLAGCTGDPDGVPADGATPGSAAIATSTIEPSPTQSMAPTPTPGPTSTPKTSSTPIPRTTYSPEDEQLATVIRVGVAEAIPELERLTDMDPSDQVALFEPLGTWITSEADKVEALTPSTCTADAVTLFLEGLDQYDEIRQLFLAWKDWGAHGRAYAYGAPRQIAATLTEAVAELGTHCPS